MTTPEQAKEPCEHPRCTWAGNGSPIRCLDCGQPISGKIEGFDATANRPGAALLQEGQAQLVAPRSDKDYAIEHAEYMAVAAENLIKCINTEGDARGAWESAEDDDEKALRLMTLEDALESTSEAERSVTANIYEFRKRRDRTLLASSAAKQAAPTEFKELLNQYERTAWRAGELWERCQGKGWPKAESDEFTKIRDERLPAIRAALSAQAAALSAPKAPSLTKSDVFAIAIAFDYMTPNCSFPTHQRFMQFCESVARQAKGLSTGEVNGIPLEGGEGNGNG